MPTVLLVEDDPELSALLCRAMEGQGLGVVRVDSLAAGKDALGRARPDLLVVDGLLPDGSGLSLIEEARGRAPVIFLSATWRDEDLLRRLTEELGVARVLHKPMSVASFLAQVRSLLGPRQGGGRRPLRTAPRALRALPAPEPGLWSALPSLVLVSPEPGGTRLGEALERELLAGVVCCSGLGRAGAMARERRVDLALAPLELAQGDPAGWQSLKEALGPGLVAVTGRSGGLDARELARRAGADLFLSDPLRLSELDDALRRALARRSPPRALVLDADGAFVDAACLRLAESGLDVVGCDRAEALFDLIAQQRPDLLLVAEAAPGPGGLALCQMLKAAPSGAAPAVLLLAEGEGPEACRAGYAAGAAAVLPRGVDAARMSACALALAEAGRDRRGLSGIDVRTGWPDLRRFLREALVRVEVEVREGRPLTVGVLRVLGLDALKAARGPREVDELLAAACRAVDARLRRSDPRGVWGDEGLAVALPGVSGADARRVLERLGRQVDAQLLERGRGLALERRLRSHCVPEDGPDLLTLLREAEPMWRPPPGA